MMHGTAPFGSAPGLRARPRYLRRCSGCPLPPHTVSAPDPVATLRLARAFGDAHPPRLALEGQLDLRGELPGVVRLAEQHRRVRVGREQLADELRRIARAEQHGHLRVPGANDAGQDGTAHAGQHDVGQEQVDGLRSIGGQIAGRLAVARHEDLVAELAKPGGGGSGDREVVLHEQQVGCGWTV